MEHETRMERNLRQSDLRITEIPPDGDYEKVRCPFCESLLVVRLRASGKCNGVITYCKKCKRTLEINKAQ